MLANFNRNPRYDMLAIEALTQKLTPRGGGGGHMIDDPQSFEESNRACMGKQKKAVGPNGTTHRLLGMLSHDKLHNLYEEVPEVWRTGDIPQHWLRCEVVLMYKKRHPEGPENY